MNTIPSELDKYNASTKVCPKAGCTAGGARQDIETMFGWRTVNGKKVAQSYCTNCRQGKKQLALFDAGPKVVAQMSSDAEIKEAERRSATLSNFPLPSRGIETDAKVLETAQHDPRQIDIQGGHAFTNFGNGPENTWDKNFGSNMATERLEAMGIYSGIKQAGDIQFKPRDAVNMLRMCTNDREDSMFSVSVRMRAGIFEIPTFEERVLHDSHHGYYYSSRDEKMKDCEDEMHVANMLIAWGVAIREWCLTEDANRKKIQERINQREAKAKEKRKAAKDKAKKAGKRYIEPEDDEEGDD